MSGMVWAICWAMTASWFWLRAAARLSMPAASAWRAGLDRVGFGETAGLDRVAVGLAVDASGVGLGLGLDLDRGRLGLGGEADFLGGGFGLADADVASGRGERGLAIGLGVGRLADVYLELLFLLLRLQLGDAGFLLDDGLAGLGLGERTLLGGLLLGAVDLGLEAGLLDLGAPDRLGDLGLGGLLLGDGGLVGLGAGDAGVLLDFGLVRHGQVLDVVADGLVMDWIWKLSMTRPKDSISLVQRSRTCWANLSWSLIISSTVIEPAMARRWPTKTFWTLDSSSAAGRSRKRRAALAIER